MVTTNQLHLQLAQRILAHVRLGGLPAGHHLTEASLQQLLGTSRGPIRAALSHLADAGVIEKRPNRGFFLTRPGAKLPAESPALPEPEDERIYLAIAADRLSGGLGEVVSENELIRRYRVPRNRLQRILGRIAAEGWIERRAGKGWSFLPMIDSLQAYLESYHLRRILEPAGVLSPTFKLVPDLLQELRERQQFIYRSGFQTYSQSELFDANSYFHESIATMSGNRFLAQTVARQNELRRLVEYRQILDRARVRRQSGEHLAIIERLDDGDRQGAADLLASHLGGAAREKARPDVFRTSTDPVPGPGHEG